MESDEARILWDLNFQGLVDVLPYQGEEAGLFSTDQYRRHTNMGWKYEDEKTPFCKKNQTFFLI